MSSCQTGFLWHLVGTEQLPINKEVPPPIRGWAVDCSWGESQQQFLWLQPSYTIRGRAFFHPCWAQKEPPANGIAWICRDYSKGIRKRKFKTGFVLFSYYLEKCYYHFWLWHWKSIKFILFKWSKLLFVRIERISLGHWLMDQSKGGLTMKLMKFKFSGFFLAWAPPKILYS